MDSLEFMELMTDISARFEKKFPKTKLLACDSVGDVLRLVCEDNARAAEIPN